MHIHATCIAFHNEAVLLVGPPGVGKSDVGLRLLDGGAQLIADDQTLLTLKDGLLMATAPLATRGLFEIRHVGLVRMPYQDQAIVRLYVDLVSLNDDLERLPEPEPVFLLDQPVQRLRLPGVAASTPAKIRAALLHPFVTDQ